MKIEDLLKLKIRLLTEGARLPEGASSGRSGGAGPVLGRYFLLPNGRPCGIPIRRGEMADKYNSAYLEPTDDPSIWFYDNIIELKIVPKPRFLDLETSDGTPYRKLALLHGSDCLATTTYQNCRYWMSDSQCAFCTIPTSLEFGSTILEKSPDHIASVVKAAENEGVVKHLLMTTGTPNGGDMGALRLVAIISKIREFSNIPIGVQIEPPTDLSLIDALANAGANAIGLHIESADETIRQEMCPGKYEYGSIDLYMSAWKRAVEHMGRGNVSTFILYGLGEDLAQTLGFVDQIAELGVLAVVSPMRPAPGSKLEDFIPTYVGHLEESIEFYKKVGQILFEHEINPSKTIAGCHRCGGCTPLQEAYDWAATMST